VQVSLRFIESCERGADYVRTCSWVTDVRVRQRHVYRPHAPHQPLARARLSLQQQGRDVRVPEGVEGGEVAELYLQGLDRRGVSEEPGGGIGR
jgi:hypothetical protein